MTHQRLTTRRTPSQRFGVHISFIPSQPCNDGWVVFIPFQDWDKPEYIPDPDAKKPEDWDDDTDGEWEPPMIPNPEYKVHG